MKMKVTGGAAATTGLTRRQQLEAGKEYGNILPNSGGHYEKMIWESGTSATTRLTKRQQLEEGKECGQILPTAEIIMNNESERRSLGNNKAHEKAAAEGRQGVRTDPPQQRRTL